MRRKGWGEEPDAICAEIRSNRRPFKIVLKTRNEGLLLRKWVEHHRRICGPQGLIIFDNGSTMPEVLAYLDEIADDIPVYSYTWMHNFIHNRDKRFRLLYDALRASSDYHLFLDTDEFLYWADEEGGYRDDATVAERIVGTGQQAIPGIWAHNQPGQERHLRFTFRKGRLEAGIRGGKPVLSSAVEVSGEICHNSQVPKDLFRGASVGNVIIAHLRNFSAQQRIAANVEKISSYNRTTKILHTVGLTGEVLTLEELLRVDDRRLGPGNARNYLAEIRLLTAGVGEATSDGAGAVPIVIFADGRMTFANKRERQEILAFLNDPAEVLAAALLAPR